MSTVYDVQIRLNTQGNFAPPMRAARGLDDQVTRMRRNNDQLRGEIANTWRTASSAFDGFARRVATVGVGAGLVGLGAGVMAAHKGVFELNSELETTQLSLATIFNAQGMANGLDDGLVKAKTSINEMRTLAAKLPGEFEDLKNIMVTTAIPSFRAGLGLESHREFSAKLMAAGVVAQLPLDQVARESAQLMEGRSGGHNALGVRLMGLSGDSAESFNKLSFEQRFAKLNTELDKYSGAIDRFGDTFGAQQSTLADAGKNFLQQSTQPLYDIVKSDMASINRWLVENRSEVDRWAKDIGLSLVDAWKAGKSLLLEWGPVFMQFARNAKAELQLFWSEWGPAISDIGLALKTALGDRDTIRLLKTAGEVWLAVSAAQAIGGLGRGIMTGVQGVGAGYGWLMNGSAAVGGAGAAGAARAGWAGLAGLSEIPGFAMLGSELSAIAAAAGPVVLAFGEVAMAGDALRDIARGKGDNSTWMQYGVAAAGLAPMIGALPLVGAGLIAEQLGQGASKQHAADMKSAYDFAFMKEGLDTAGKSAFEIAVRQRDYAEQLGHLIATTPEFTDSLTYATLEASIFATELAGARAQVRAFGDAQAAGIGDDATLRADLHNREAIDKLIGPKKDRPGGMGAGTTIQKVEIVVTSNAEPNRVARLAVDRMLQVSRNVRRSPDVRNFSSPRT